MNLFRLLPRSLIGVFAVVAFLFVVEYYGAPVLAYQVPATVSAPSVPAPGSLAYREANEFYQDCLERRDAGDMRCGESCFWRECITCANVCTLSCYEDGDCGCR